MKTAWEMNAKEESFLPSGSCDLAIPECRSAVWDKQLHLCRSFLDWSLQTKPHQNISLKRFRGGVRGRWVKKILTTAFGKDISGPASPPRARTDAVFVPERDAVFTPRWGISSWHRSLPAASERSKPPSFTSASFASRKFNSLPQSIQPIWSHRHSRSAAQVKAAARLSCFEIQFLRSGAAAGQWTGAPSPGRTPSSAQPNLPDGAQRGAEASPRAHFLPGGSSCSGRDGAAARSFSPPAGMLFPAKPSRSPPRAVRYRLGRGAAPGAGPATCCSSAPAAARSGRRSRRSHPGRCPSACWVAAAPSRCRRRAPPRGTARPHGRRGGRGEGGERSGCLEGDGRRGWTPAVPAVRDREPRRVSVSKRALWKALRKNSVCWFGYWLAVRPSTEGKAVDAPTFVRSTHRSLLC